ncbi:MAG: hypothetical protein U1B77_03035, partial [Dehalococcoidales bacterium]|nr:hypothetical protein [Dehalococcoidales bacterium]
MKNQYFGDNKDLFKYDLVCYLIRRGLADRFTFIPMLTMNDNTGQGKDRVRSKAKAGSENSCLVTFLDRFADRNKRDVKKLRGFLKKYGIEAEIFGDYFHHEERERYFQDVSKKLPPKSLIFVDPDVGLQVKRTRDKHIKYCELNNLFERMDKSSILMLYQHFPRIRTQSNIQKYFYDRSIKLKETGGSLLIDYIEDGEI